MALGDVIARLAVNLALNTGAFEEGADEAERRLRQSARRFEQIGGSMMAVGAKMALAFTAPLAAAGRAVLGIADDVKALQNAASVAGESFESFQRGAAAAKTVGVEFDKFGDILKDTQDKLGDFAANGGGEMADFFENVAPKVGVTIDMFRNLSGSQALQLYYDSLVKAKVPQKEMVFYMESIADEGSALIPILANNGKLMKEIGGNAAIISDSDAEGMKRYTDAQAKLADAFRKLQIVLAKSGIIEAATAIVDTFASMVTWFAELPAPVQKVIVAVSALVAAAGPLLVVLGTIISSGATVFAALGTIGTAMASTGSAVGALTVAFAALRGAVIAFATALGPVGIAMAAIGAAMGYLYVKSIQADEATRKLKEGIAQQSAELAAVRGQQQKVALLTGQMSKEQLRAITITANLTGQAHLLADAWARVAAEMKGAALMENQRKRDKALQLWMGAAEAYGKKKNSALASQGPLFTDAERAKAAANAERAAVNEKVLAQEAWRNLSALRQQSAVIARTGLESWKPEELKPYTLPSDKKGGGSGKSGPSMATAEQQQRELDRLAMEELQAKLALATSAEARAQISRDILAAEKAQRIAEIEASDTFTRAQKDAQIAYLERLYGPKAAAEGEITVQPGLFDVKLQREIETEQMQQANAMLSMQADALQALADIEPNTRERARLEREALALQQQIQRNLLDQAIATGEVKDAEQARAMLAQQQAADRTRMDRENMTPLQRYQHDLKTGVANVNDAMESIQVDAMQGLTDGLAGAIAGTQKLGQVFANVAQSIIADLARIAIQRAVVGSITRALPGLFGGGGAGGGSLPMDVSGLANNTLSAIPKFATGTPSAPSGLALLGERGPELVAFSGGERVYNHADSKAMMRGRQPTSNVFDMRGALVTEDLLAQMDGIASGRANMAVVNDKRRETRRATRKLGR